MSSNVGLSTPRGSGTSGYVQRNLSVLKTRDHHSYGQPYPDPKRDLPRQRKPDRDILDHDRKREVEVKVFDLRDRLEEEGGLDEDEIDDRCEKLRRKLLQDEGADDTRGKGKGKNLKPHQVHELAEAKIKESERLRKALRLKKEDVDDEEKRPTEGFARLRTE